MLRSIAASSALTLLALTGFAGTANAQATNPTAKAPNPLKCVGASEHKQAQTLRLQALSADLAALNSRLSVAQANNKTEAVARIQANIARINARVAAVQANQVKLTTRCP